METNCCVAGRYADASVLGQDLADLPLDEAYGESLDILADTLILGCPGCIQRTVVQLAETMGWPMDRAVQLAFLTHLRKRRAQDVQ